MSKHITIRVEKCKGGYTIDYRHDFYRRNKNRMLIIAADLDNVKENVCKFIDREFGKKTKSPKPKD